MEMSGERQIAASRAEVWAALNDPEVLKACIPGCQEMEKTGDNGYIAKVVQKVGPVKATFTGEVELSDIVEGESYTISGKGKGGAAGGASGGAKVTLADSDGGTLLTYVAEAKVTGKIAQLGSRLIDGFAKKMADQFFTTFQEQVEGPSQTDRQSAGIAGETHEAEPAHESSGDRLDAAIDSVVETADAAGEKVTELGQSAAAKAEAMTHSISEKAENLSQTASKKFEEAKDFASEKIDAAKAQASEQTENLKEQASETTEKLKEAASETIDTVKEVADKAEAVARETVGKAAAAIQKAEPEKKGFWRRLFGG